MRNLRSAVERIRLLPDWLIDLLVGAAFAGAGLLELSIPAGPDPRGFDLEGLPAYVVLAAMTLPLAVRRKSPLITFALMTVAFTLQPLLGIRDVRTEALSYGVALYSLVACSERPTAIVAFGISVLVSVPGVNPLVLGPAPLVYNSLFLGLVFAAGRTHSERADLERRLEERTRTLLTAREELVTTAVARERLQIAGELESSIRRSVAQMLDMIATPDARDHSRMRDVMTEVERGGRDALRRMRTLLGLLRAAELPREASSWDRELRPAVAADPRATRIGSARVVGDVVLVVSLVVSVVAEFATGQSPISGRPAFAACVSLAFLVGLRRSAPLVVAGVASAAIFTVHVTEGPALPVTVLITLLVLVYTVFAERGPAQGAVAGALALVAYVNSYGELAIKLSLLFFVLINVVFAGALGQSIRRRARAIEKTVDINSEIEKTHHERAQLAVAMERLSVAREMHDLIGHGITLMVVQAGGARAIAEKDPPRAKEALVAIESAGRKALAEVDQLLDEIRDDTNVTEEPDLESIVGRARQAGAQIEVKGNSSEVMLPGLARTVYRIVQEAVTNALKHSPGAPIEVRLGVLGPDVCLAVENGRARYDTPGGGAPGFGLLGIAERTRAFGGSFEAKATSEGGFVVRASIPVGQSS